MIDESKLIYNFEFMKKYGVDISGGRPGNATAMEEICRRVYNKGWMDCKATMDVPDTNVGEWTPCSEPPKYTGDYLVTVGINRDGLGMYDEVRTANYNTFYETWTVHEDWRNAIGTNPIAWMPLPEPYKKGE